LRRSVGKRAGSLTEQQEREATVAEKTSTLFEVYRDRSMLLAFETRIGLPASTKGPSLDRSANTWQLRFAELRHFSTRHLTPGDLPLSG